MEENIYHKIVYELAKEKNIEVTELSYGWILELKKDGQVRHIIGNKYDLNNEAMANIACDKYATYEVLKNNNIPVIAHKILFSPEERSRFVPEDGNAKRIEKFFYENGEKIVVKANDSSKGEDVYLCEDVEYFKEKVELLFKENPTLSMCPYYDIEKEYRLFYLDGEILLVYGKNKPFIIGNGKDTARIIVENEGVDLKIIEDNKDNIDFDYIPKEGEKYEISWKHNLSLGAYPEILEEGSLRDTLIDIAKRAGKAMNIKFATIDIIKTKDNQILVLEINSSVCMRKFIERTENGYEIAKDIYGKALDKLWE